MDVVSNPRISTGETLSPKADDANDVPGLDEKNEAIRVWMGGGGFFRPTSASQGGTSSGLLSSQGELEGASSLKDPRRGSVGGVASDGGLRSGTSATIGQGSALRGERIGTRAEIGEGAQLNEKSFRIGTVVGPKTGVAVGAGAGLVAGGVAAVTFSPISSTTTPSPLTRAALLGGVSTDSIDTPLPSVDSTIAASDTEASSTAASTAATSTAATSTAATSTAATSTAATDTAATSTAATSSAMPSATDTRPSGDTRSAEDIVNSNPTLKNMGNQENILTNLKKQCGDWTDPSLTPAQRADAAYRASEVVNYVKSSSASDGTARSTNVTEDGKIDGFTASKQARHGTEAGLMKDFGEKGYSALPTDHRLPTTTDPYVNKDGTTKSNAKVIGEKIAKALLSIVKVLMNVVSQVLSVVADLKIPGLSQLAAAASVGTKAASDAANIGVTALDGGDVKQAAKQMGIDVAEQTVSSLTAPGMGKVVGKGIEEGVESGVKSGESVAQRAAKAGAEQVAGQVYGQYAPSPASLVS